MNINNLRYNVILILILSSITATAQELPKGYKISMEMNVDEKGDVAVSTVTKYNAEYWDYIKASKALEPSIMKNTLKRQFPKYQLTDFEIDSKSEESERTSKIKFKILGSLKLDANGKWIADLETKNPNITKISDTKFLLIDESTAQTITINLPGSASGSKLETDAFGKAILTYTAPVSSGGLGNIIKYLGFLVAAAGGFLFFKNRKLHTVVVNDPRHQKIDFHQSKKIEDAEVIHQNIKENVKHGNNTANSHE